MKKRFLFGLCLLLTLCVGSFFTMISNVAAESEQIEVAVKDVMRSGDDVFINEPVKGDVFIFAKNAKVRALVTGNVYIMSENASIEAPVQGSVHIMAQDIDISSSIAGNIYAMSEDVDFQKSAILEQNMYFLAQKIRLDGNVKNDVFGQARDIVLAGMVDHNMDVIVQDFVVEDSAFVKNELRYESHSDLEISPERAGAGVFYSKINTQSQSNTWFDLLGVYGYIVLLFGFLVIGMVLIKLWPRHILEMLLIMTKHYSTTTVKGLLYLLLTPFILVFLVFTLIGIPLAILYVLVTFVIMFLSHILVSIFIGFRLLEQFYVKKAMKPLDSNGLMYGLLIGTVFFFALIAIPFIGNIISFLSLCFGVGTIVVWLRRHMENG